MVMTNNKQRENPAAGATKIFPLGSQIIFERPSNQVIARLHGAALNDLYRGAEEQRFRELGDCCVGHANASA